MRSISILQRAVCAVSAVGAAASVAWAAPTTLADVQVTQAWVRPAVKGQLATGGFMTLTSTKGTKLLGFASPVANSSQLHEMTMAGDVMQMREVASLALPAGQAVSLKPGGHHLMLIGLKKVLKSGDQVPLQLKLQAADGRLYRQSLTVPVAAKQP